MLEQFEVIYAEYLEAIQEKAGEYYTARKSRDYAAIQNVRDGLVEGDVLLAPDFVTEALTYWQAMENERKECEASRRIEYRKLVGKSKNGDTKKYTYATAKEAEDAAFLACGEARRKEMAALKNYKKARELESRKEQLLHSIASRIRGNE